MFDALLARGEIVIHPTEVERLVAVADLATESPDDLVVADTREQVAGLNATVRDRRIAAGTVDSGDTAGDRLAVGDRVTTRRNDRGLDVANRDQWTVVAIGDHSDLEVEGRRGRRTLPASYAETHVELCYATTVHGAQGETVDHTHVLLGETTGAASAYVAMTRGRHHNTAHLVAKTVEHARAQWVDTFARDRADLGPTRARESALEAIDRYGPQSASMQRAALNAARSASAPRPGQRRPDPVPTLRPTSPPRAPGR